MAAGIGGAMWVVKGASILLTGVQPPVVFEAALPFFAVALLGLGARLGRLRGSLGNAGIAVACVAAISAFIALATGWPPFIAIAGFGPFLGLILLGGATLRTRVFPSPWSALPLAVGLGGPLLILMGGILALIDERLLEVPILMIGFAWILVGYSLVAVKSAPARSSPPA